ncbi:MAG: ABC transporter permease [Candidatus Scalindua sp.]|nr:ABC transporter permease [Candidatus Scalindua sp.]
MELNSDMRTIIKPRSGWELLNLRELIEYRDLFFFTVWRDITAQYAQTVLGFSWAIIQPLVQIVLFSIIFGKIARVSTDGVPYLLFSSVAIIPWTYMSQSMTMSSQSLVLGSKMLGKIYFPRLIYPITPVLSNLVNFGISIIIIFFIMFYYRVSPTWNLLYLPLFFVMMISVPLSAGLWLSSLAIRYRDVKHGMPFFIQILMYTAPIVYTASSVPEKYRMIYSINPIVGVIEGYRACLLGTAVPWLYIWPGMVTAVILVISGAFYFRRFEKIIVDVI